MTQKYFKLFVYNAQSFCTCQGNLIYESAIYLFKEYCFFYYCRVRKISLLSIFFNIKKGCCILKERISRTWLNEFLILRIKVSLSFLLCLLFPQKKLIGMELDASSRHQKNLLYLVLSCSSILFQEKSFMSLIYFPVNLYDKCVVSKFKQNI